MANQYQSKMKSFPLGCLILVSSGPGNEEPPMQNDLSCLVTALLGVGWKANLTLDSV